MQNGKKPSAILAESIVEASAAILHEVEVIMPNYAADIRNYVDKQRYEKSLDKVRAGLHRIITDARVLSIDVATDPMNRSTMTGFARVLAIEPTKDVHAAVAEEAAYVPSKRRADSI